MNVQLSTMTNNKPALPIGTRGIELENFEALWRFAQCIAASPFAPKGMEKAEAIVPAIQLGLELGLTPMAALQNVAVINGRPGIYGDAALALVRASGFCESYTQEISGEGDNRRASVTSKRKGAEALTNTFSVADAKRAGLWGKQGPWSQYPDRMLLFRARGFNLRDNFGDVLKGLATVEEVRDMHVEKQVNGREVGTVTIKPEPTNDEPPAQPPAVKRTGKKKEGGDLTLIGDEPEIREKFTLALRAADASKDEALAALKKMHLAPDDLSVLLQVEDAALAAALDRWLEFLTFVETERASTK